MIQTQSRQRNRNSNRRLILNNLRRVDPTGTTPIQRRWIADFNRRYDRLAREVRELVFVEDVFGLKPRPNPLIGNTRWAFQTDSRKVSNFNAWLMTRIEEGVLEVPITTDPDAPWTSVYTTNAYRKGVTDAYISAKKASGNIDISQEEFLRSSFSADVTVDRLRMMSTRAFDQLKGISSQQAQNMSRVLTDGLSRGDGVRQLTRDLVKEVGVSKTRAQRIARTETVHSYAEGQLDSFERLGIEEVGVMAEWSTTEDDRVCPMCESLNGVVMTVKEARGLIPRHPNCRCAWIPANVGEKKTKKQKIGKTSVEQAIERSALAETGPNIRGTARKRSRAERIDSSNWKGVDTKISSAARRKARREAAEASVESAVPAPTAPVQQPVQPPIPTRTTRPLRPQPAQPEPTPTRVLPEPETPPGGGLDTSQFPNVEKSEFDDRILAGAVKNARAQHKTAKDVGRAWAKNEPPPRGMSRPATERNEKVYAALDKRYQETQAQLVRDGVEEVEAYRGLDVPVDSQLAKDIKSGKLKPGDTYKVKGDNINSYSTSQDIAESFAETPIPQVDASGEFTSARIDEESFGVLIRRKIPRRDVVATPDSSAGYSLQKEVIGIDKEGVEYEIVKVFDVENIP